MFLELPIIKKIAPTNPIITSANIPIMMNAPLSQEYKGKNNLFIRIGFKGCSKLFKQKSTKYDNYHDKNFANKSGVGIMHWSFLPYHL